MRPNRDALTTPFSFLRLAGREEWVPINEDGLTRVSGPLDSALISPSLSSFQRRHAEEAGARVGGCCPPSSPSTPPSVHVSLYRRRARERAKACTWIFLQRRGLPPFDLFLAVECNRGPRLRAGLQAPPDPREGNLRARGLCAFCMCFD